MAPRLTFSKLSLLSQKEQRALQIVFKGSQTLIKAGNGYGKSAIVKSLYETLGAKPHKIDQAWKDADVTSLLEFNLDGVSFRALKTGDVHAFFDANNSAMIRTTHVMSDLGPFLAELLDFRLVLTSKRDEIQIPPPSFAFAPFYVDQDQSWQKPWSAFRDLVMFPHASKSLAEYHSGLRPNGYYQAKAERDHLKIEMNRSDAERRAVQQALAKVRDAMPSTPLSFNLDRFSGELDRLVSESQALHDEQAKYRGRLALLSEEFHLWSDQLGLIRAALLEIDETFTGALEQPTDVECPMCGQHYHNNISDQFELVADKDDLYQAYLKAKEKLDKLNVKIRDHRNNLDQIRLSIDNIKDTLKIHKADISLRDVIAAEGKNEAERVLLDQLGILDEAHGAAQRRVTDAESQMKEFDSRTRKLQIRAFFMDHLVSYARQLDVRLPAAKSLNLQGLNIGRGSEGPRALAAYYYAFLHTAKEYGSSAFCPIVIDAPNQQGQDKQHLRGMIDFLLTSAPSGAQVIVATETSTFKTEALTLDVSWKKDQVLREDEYEPVLEYIRPLLRQSIEL